MDGDSVIYPETSVRTRSWALLVLCLGSLLITVDTSIVNVALPSIRADLGLSEDSLIWVVDAYLVTFGGFLLLGGRLGDLLGCRPVFLFGVALFTLASLGCGLARSQGTLIGCRAIQGFGGAIVCVLTVSLILGLFREAPERAKALGAYAFVSAAGGSIGLMLGGTLTSALSWQWIFLVNIPIGTAVYILGLAFLPHGVGGRAGKRIDIAGTVSATASVTIAIYVIINGNRKGWASAQTLLGLATAAMLLVVFVRLQARARIPLMPLRLFRIRNLLVANIAGVLVAVGTFGWFFIYARYLQFVLSYDPLQVALAYLPANAIVAAVSLCISPTLVARCGIRLPLAFGLLTAAAGLALLARAPVSANNMFDVLPGMLLIGLGTGTANAPLLLGALNDVEPRDSGVASGIVRTTSLMGGALGLSILGSIASSRTNNLLASGVELKLALQSGYHAALYVAVVFLVAAAALGGLLGSHATAAEATPA
jgi:EmrB/QacA subfamily drug resistance transporter